MAGVIVNNYGSLPVVFDHGNGATLYDTDGKAYIDFVAYIVEDFAYIDLVVILKEQQALEVVQKALVEALPLIEDLVVIAVVVVVEVVEVKKVLLALEEEQKALVVVNSLMEQVEVNH